MQLTALRAAADRQDVMQPLTKMGRRMLLALLLCMGLGDATAQPHLVPHGSPIVLLSPYDVVLAEVFGRTGPPHDVLVHVLLLPSFDREAAAGVRRTASGYEAFSVLPESSLWAAVVGVDGSGSWDADAARGVGLRREAVPLDSSTADLLHRVWERTILGTRYPHRPRSMRDGVIANFSAWVDDRGVISGMTHSPPAGSPAALLMELGVRLGEYARGGGVSLPDLRARAQELLSVITE
jgi:hypothetical protein